MERKIRWGILGTGSIAKKFTEALQSLPDVDIVAVGSRAVETAERFAETFDVRHRHSSYEELANDPDVEVVYVATPHPFHMENTILCLKAGKAVLCEKPFAMNANQAQQMITQSIIAQFKPLFIPKTPIIFGFIMFIYIH